LFWNGTPSTFRVRGRGVRGLQCWTARSRRAEQSYTAEMSASRAQLILVLNHFQGWRPPAMGSELCEVTMEPARRDAADALGCHLPTWRGPPVIPKRPGQRLVALSLESKVNAPLLNNAGFMRQFDMVMSYRRDATIHCAYLDPAILARLREPPPPKPAKAPLVCFISNASDRCGRAAYLSELDAPHPGTLLRTGSAEPHASPRSGA
jgi:glycosyl transferase family 10 (putative fucosyltransferase)